jgi:hypothetical protein
MRGRGDLKLDLQIQRLHFKLIRQGAAGEPISIFNFDLQSTMARIKTTADL